MPTFSPTDTAYPDSPPTTDTPSYAPPQDETAIAPVPASQSGGGSVHAAGFVFLLAILGAAAGGYKYGAKGAAAGFLAVGAGVNAIRAARLKNDPDSSRREEALWSGISAAAGAGLAGWLVWKT